MQAKLGAHMSIAGGCEKAVKAASLIGFQTVQLFTKNNNQWKASPLSAQHVERFRQSLEETGIVDPIAHTSYLINLASPDDELWKRSIDAMVVEVERCQALGIADLVVHPGAHTGSGEEAGLSRVALALDEIDEKTFGSGVTIDLETTAGQGTSLGCRFEHLARILEQAARPEAIGICVDTCHIFAAGYSIDTDEGYDETMEELATAVGVERVRAWHLNDSLKGKGSRVDRHAGIGQGAMGLLPFRRVLRDPRFLGLPMILETPKGTEAGEDLDVRNLRILRALESDAPLGAAEALLTDNSNERRASSRRPRPRK